MLFDSKFSCEISLLSMYSTSNILMVVDLVKKLYCNITITCITI